LSRLEGKVAVITGAGSGIGMATSRLFLEMGCKVICSDISDQFLSELENEISSYKPNYVILNSDVTKRSDCKKIANEAINNWGKLDILVNSAGVTPRHAPADWDFEQKWDFVMEVNLKGSMLMSYESVEQMKKKPGGSIINLSSIIGLVGYSDTLGFSDGFNPYPHSKGGVVQMTRDMGVNLAKYSIRVNALCPGFAYTNLTKSITDDETVHKKLIELHPMGRLGTADDIANAALFLASDESSFITGTAIPVDGGYTAR
jgi:NAD(P)-dependent dehydrogenase (short-subunit alcohol dehydrogenase family)|tara:strand:+ start:11004 stop:11780 length:777 start_codon:yes stop_codon:yes gene_type:complete